MPVVIPFVPFSPLRVRVGGVLICPCGISSAEPFLTVSLCFLPLLGPFSPPQHHRFRSPSNTSSVTVPQQTDIAYGLLLLFALDRDENMLTRERVQVVRRVEQAVMELQGDPPFSDVCARSRGTGVRVVGGSQGNGGGATTEKASREGPVNAEEGQGRRRRRRRGIFWVSWRPACERGIGPTSLTYTVLTSVLRHQRLLPPLPNVAPSFHSHSSGVFPAAIAVTLLLRLPRSGVSKRLSSGWKQHRHV